MLTSILYRLYERRLRAELRREPLPHHIGLILCDAYWPAFRKIDLLRAIRSYQQRQRRFGWY